MDHRHNPGGRLARVLMLPGTENRPPGRTQFLAVMEIRQRLVSILFRQNSALVLGHVA